MPEFGYQGVFGDYPEVFQAALADAGRVQPIDSYLADLGRALRGPRRMKADLLAEALGSLEDATERYRSTGFDATQAQRRAVDEFGEVRRVAPQYQAELGLHQVRRTALLVFAVLAVQPVLWGPARRPLAGGGTGDPGPVFAVLDESMQWLGGAAMAVALAAVVATRVSAAPPGLVRVAGRFALVVAAGFALLGLVMTVLGHGTTTLLQLTGLPWTLAVLVVPMAYVALSARRCLAAAIR
jgi:hypothetical protein